MVRGRGYTWLHVLMMLCGAGLVAVSGPDGLPRWLRVAVGVVLLLAGLWFYWRHQYGDAPGGLAESAPEPVSVADILESARYVQEHYGPDAIRGLTEVLTDLPEALSRVVTRTEITGGAVTSRTSLTFRGFTGRGSAATKRVILPIVFAGRVSCSTSSPRRGQMAPCCPRFRTGRPAAWCSRSCATSSKMR